MLKRAVFYSWLGGRIMITIFKNKQDIPQNMEYIELNDLYFVQNTVSQIDDRAEKIIECSRKRN